MEIADKTWQEVAAIVLNKLGRLVIQSPRQEHVGKVVRNLNVSRTKDTRTDQPFLIVGIATFDDWVAQCEFTDRAVDPSERSKYYYFVQTD